MQIARERSRSRASRSRKMKRIAQRCRATVYKGAAASALDYNHAKRGSANLLCINRICINRIKYRFRYFPDWDIAAPITRISSPTSGMILAWKIFRESARWYDQCTREEREVTQHAIYVRSHFDVKDYSPHRPRTGKPVDSLNSRFPLPASFFRAPFPPRRREGRLWFSSSLFADSRVRGPRPGYLIPMNEYLASTMRSLSLLLSPQKIPRASLLRELRRSTHRSASRSMAGVVAQARTGCAASTMPHRSQRDGKGDAWLISRVGNDNWYNRCTN